MYATLGMVLDAAQVGIDNWAFWCILGLFIASEWMTRREVMEQVQQYVTAVRDQAARVAQAAKDVQDVLEEKNK